MNEKENTATGTGTVRLFFTLLLRHILFASLAAVVVFVFQRKRILSGEWLGWYTFLCWAAGSVTLLALILTVRGLVLSRWKTVVWNGGREIILTSRFGTRIVVLDTLKTEAHIGGSVFGLGRKGEIVSGGKHYLLLMGGFGSDEWNALENILVSIQLWKARGSDAPQVGPPDFIVR